MVLRVTVVLACVVALTQSVINDPCNERVDCGTDECCDFDNALASKAGFRGMCKKALGVGDPCSLPFPERGECGCTHGTTCVLISDTPKCLYLPQR